jgi:hypothetical protein
MIMPSKIPKKEKDLLEYGSNFNRCNGVYGTELGLVATEVTALEALRLKFKELHEQCANRDQPKTVTKAKDEALSKYKEDLQAFIKELQANRKMTDPIRADYNISIAKKPSEVVPPIYGPDSEGESSSKAAGRATVSYIGTKEDSSLSVDIGYHVGPAAVQSHAELSFYDNFSHNPWTHTFPETQSGMMFTYALRWRSKHGKVSEWSALRFFRLT